MEELADGILVAADGWDPDEIMVEVKEGGRFAANFLVMREWLLPIDRRRKDAPVGVRE